MNIYKTKIMLAAVNQMEPVHSFLRDRYFPTGAGDTFPTDEVLVEYKNTAAHKLAPIVVNGHDGITVGRNGYKTFRMEPPTASVKRTLTEDDLRKKGFGEDVFSNMTPAERQQMLLAQDLVELDEMHTNLEEFIASKCIFGNGYTLKQYADEYGSGNYIPYDMKFYDGEVNPATYTPGVKWDGNGSDKLADIYQMIRMLTTAGNAAQDVLLGSDAADALLADEKIQKMFDLNRFDIGSIAPELMSDGAALLGVLNIRGHRVNVITYDGVSEDENGNITPYIPTKSICVTAPGAGRTLYGCVTQVDEPGGVYNSYEGRRVPRYWSDKSGREIRVCAKPLLVPKTKNPFISATVLD